MDLGVTVLVLACRVTCSASCRLWLCLLTAENRVLMGEHHFTLFFFFFPKSSLFQFPGLVQKYRGLALFLPAQVKPLARSHRALKWIPKNCSTNHWICILLGYLSRKVLSGRNCHRAQPERAQNDGSSPSTPRPGELCWALEVTQSAFPLSLQSSPHLNNVPDWIQRVTV